jgi:site-specific recombinase XerC
MKTQNLKRVITEQEVESFIQQNPEVKRWIRKTESPHTRYHYVKDLIRYCESVEKTPAELIRLKQNQNHEAEDLLDEFVEEAQKVLSNSMVWNISKAVKSFYSWNYAPLSRGAGKVSLVKKKPYRTPDKETIKKFMEGMNIRDIALISFMASTGIAAGSIPQLNIEHVKELETEEIPHIALTSAEVKGKGKGKYQGIEQHTFLTPYAKQKLLAYLKWRENKEGRKLEAKEPLFTTVVQPFTRLSLAEVCDIFNRRSHENPYGIQLSPHDLRRFVQTALETARVQPNWIRKILRHKVSGEENPYSQPKIEALREAYKTALPYLDLTEKRGEEINELEMRKKLILDTAKMIGLPEERLQRLKQILAQSETVEEAIETFHRIGEEEEQEDCQKIVEENELATWLKKGFRFVAVLPSGKILITNEA